jgi:hypothetical protein
MSPPERNKVVTPLSAPVGQLQLHLRDHGIIFFWPPGGVLECREMTLPGGALISGEVRGSIRCTSGSVLISKDAKVIGDIEADKIFIEGTVGSTEAHMSELRGRYMLAVSATASVIANLWSRSYAIHGGSIFGTLSPWA